MGPWRRFCSSGVDLEWGASWRKNELPSTATQAMANNSGEKTHSPHETTAPSLSVIVTTLAVGNCQRLPCPITKQCRCPFGLHSSPDIYTNQTCWQHLANLEANPTAVPPPLHCECPIWLFELTCSNQSRNGLVPSMSHGPAQTPNPLRMSRSDS